MVEFFWESTQKARTEHFCDRCFNWIIHGDIYSRKIWKPSRDKFFVMNEHVDPHCPPEEMMEEMVEEPMRLVVSYKLVNVEVLVRMADGSLKIETQLKAEPHATIEPPDFDNNGDLGDVDDIPF